MTMYVLVSLLLCTAPVSPHTDRKPNILILLVDDLGSRDLGCYGNSTIKTPNIDSLAIDGAKLTHHLAAASLCTPSRTALMTGRYPSRLGMAGTEDSPRVVIYSGGRVGLPQGELTLGTLASHSNYCTGAVGKWHLGLHGNTWGDQHHGPLGHGFQYFYGLPFTLVPNFEKENLVFFKFERSAEHFRELAVILFCLIPLRWLVGRKTWFSLVVMTMFLGWFFLEHFTLTCTKWWRNSPYMERFLNSFLMENQTVVQKPVQLEGLETTLVEKSEEFMSGCVSRGSPFLLYHAFPAVHTPLVPGVHTAGHSVHGSYGDKVQEVDWAVGRLLGHLDKLGVAGHTLVYLASDHGGDQPQEGDQGGWNGEFRGGKANAALEGGIRIPGLVRWPGVIRPGLVINQPTSLLDIAPTLATVVGHPALAHTDGVSLVSSLKEEQVLEPRTLYHHCGTQVFAMRRDLGDGTVYKLILKEPLLVPGEQRCLDSECDCFGAYVRVNNPALLYEISRDPSEDNPLDPSSSLYTEITDIMLRDLEVFLASPRPPSQLNDWTRVMPAPWLQPVLDV